MAERRMFTKKVTDDDNFMSLSSSAQALYLHLSMSADDDGFSNQVGLSMFKAHASVQDLEALLEKRYIYQFENGVIVIKHWRMANALRKDRYKPTQFQEELHQLRIKENDVYTMSTDGCQMVANGLPQDRLGKDRLDKDRLGESDGESETPKRTPKESKSVYGEYSHVRLKDSERDKLVEELGQGLTDACITFLDEYIEMKGYKAKSHYLCIKKWVVDAVKERKPKTNKVAEQLEQSYEMMSRWAEEDEDGN